MNQKETWLQWAIELQSIAPVSYTHLTLPTTSNV